MQLSIVLTTTCQVITDIVILLIISVNLCYETNLNLKPWSWTHESPDQAQRSDTAPLLELPHFIAKTKLVNNKVATDF